MNANELLSYLCYNRRMKGLITMLLTQAFTNLMLWLLIVPLVLIFGLIIVALVIRIIKQTKYYGPNRAPNKDPEQVTEFMDAFGGKDNIILCTKEMSRLHVTLKDVGLMKASKLQELGATGVLIVGDVVKASFNDRIDYVYALFEEVHSHE